MDKKLSQCCSAEPKTVDNWDMGHTEKDTRFVIVCSECKEDFVKKDEK